MPMVRSNKERTWIKDRGSEKAGGAVSVSERAEKIIRMKDSGVCGPQRYNHLVCMNVWQQNIQ